MREKVDGKKEKLRKDKRKYFFFKCRKRENDDEKNLEKKTDRGREEKKDEDKLGENLKWSASCFIDFFVLLHGL